MGDVMRVFTAKHYSEVAIRCEYTQKIHWAMSKKGFHNRFWLVKNYQINMHDEEMIGRPLVVSIRRATCLFGHFKMNEPVCV